MVTKVELSREEAAVEEIGHTDFARGTAAFLVVALLLTILSVPVIQQIHDVNAYRAGQRASPWSASGEILASLPRAWRALANTQGSILSKSLAASDSLHADIQRCETALADDSVVSQAILPPLEHFLAGQLGVGNEKAYVGRQRWLFYRPDIDFLTARGFLDPRQLHKRAHSGDRWTPPPQPDPIRAILQFRDQLAQRDIQLIVLPTPAKSLIHPEKFSENYEHWKGPLQNPSYAPFRAALVRQGVLVFDLVATLAQAKAQTQRAQFLETDTHWTPEAMEEAVARLQDFIAQNVKLTPTRSAAYKSDATEATNLGDIAVMLQLPAKQRLYERQTVRLSQVLNAHNELWRPTPTSEVLVLGDSFSNIYSLPGMGWGEGAGFVEQLSFHLQQPVDCILRNDAAAYATRQILSRELAKGKDRLAGKKLVLWQFAMRELAFGDWKLLNMQLGQPKPRQFVVPRSGEPLMVTGVIDAISSAPKPGSVPYKDHIIAVHLTDLEQGRGRVGGEAVAYLWSMRDNSWTAAARYRPGQKITLKLRPWSEVAEKLERINRSELSDESLQLEEPCWGEVVGKGNS
jgi:hypothetical protein